MMMISSVMQCGVVRSRVLAYEVEENGHQQKSTTLKA